MNVIPYARQDISDEDVQAVVEALRSDFLTQGPRIAEFEQAMAERCGAQYAVAVANGTAALHIACLAAGLKQGDTLWTSPNTFVASANCARYCGADVDFVDIHPETYNLSVEHLLEKLEAAKDANTLPSIVIPVHFAGQSADMEGISLLARNYGYTIIEDGSHAVGGTYQGKPIGCCQYSDMTVLSFHPVKILTTGEGGMVLTNNPKLYEKLVLLRQHGITRDPEQMEGESDGPWYYQQIELGYNYRITDLQCALGLSQLKRLDTFIARRRVIADQYDALLADLPVTIPGRDDDAESAWHLYVIRLQLDQISKSHREVFEALRAAGIQVNLHYIPVHTQPYYQRLGFNEGDFPESVAYYREAISLPMYYSLTDEEQQRVVATLKEVLA